MKPPMLRGVFIGMTVLWLARLGLMVLGDSTFLW
jgi:hypothetical protein